MNLKAQVLEISEGITQKDLNDIYSNNYIKKAFTQDNKEFKPISHPLVKYHSCYINNNFLGCFLVARYSINEIEIHSLLKKEAIRHSRELGYKILKECFIDKDVTRITALILSDLEKAKNYVKKLGFESEGIKREATFRSGESVDVEIFGLIKKDLKWVS